MLSVKKIIFVRCIVTFSKQLVTLESVEGWVLILDNVDHCGFNQVGSSSGELSNSMHQVLTSHLTLSVSITTSNDSILWHHWLGHVNMEKLHLM